MTRIQADDALRILRRYPRSSSAELCRRLDIDRSTLSRTLQRLGSQVLSAGATRRIRYAARRALRGQAAPVPVYRVDREGRGHEAGQLSLVDPDGTLYPPPPDFAWPLQGESRDGWFAGLPYPIFDMRPQGFLGRGLAAALGGDLGVSADPTRWTDDDIIHVLAAIGADQPGDLIVGERAYRRFLDGRRAGADRFVADERLEAEYLRLAEEAVSRGVVASSAAGEFPKFTSSRVAGDRRFDVIVKFSGKDASPAVRRWSDLLVCEHLATEVMRRTLGVATAESTIHRFGSRTFLEVVRFDRHGDFGRSPVCTLEAINADLLGSSDTAWTACARRLLDDQWIERSVAEAIARIWWFGRLVGNSDMHLGNLAFRPGLQLAPVYDMLPAMYAPLPGGEVVTREFAPDLPLPAEAPAWRDAAAAAAEYWRVCAEDVRIGAGFRRVCAANAEAVRKIVQ